MKVLFLDIDGVLNSWDWWRRRRAMKEHLDDGDERALYERCESLGVMFIDTDLDVDPEAVARLNKVIERTGAKIVFSSTKRLGRSMAESRELLNVTFGIKGEVIARTPAGGKRGHEIDTWLTDHADWFEVESFAIVDDNGDMDPHKDRLVKTDFAHGLLDEHCERLIELLE